MKRNGESGQAAVESAITLPLTIFLVLGTLQLFMMLQGRIMAEHAAFKAVRAGVVNHGDCRVMTHAAIAALLPSFTSYLGNATPGGSPEEKLAAAFRARTQGKPFDNQYNPGASESATGEFDGIHDRAVVWLYRVSPRIADVTPESEHDFDDPDPRPGSGDVGYTLELKLVYWYPLRIPFANWVMATMFRAYFGLGDYTTAMNPLQPANRRANWTAADGGGATLGTSAAEFVTRFNQRQWVFPIEATYTMRMMTPPRAQLFQRQNCEPTP